MLRPHELYTLSPYSGFHEKALSGLLIEGDTKSLNYGSYAVGFRVQGVLVSESSVYAKRFQRPPTLLTARRLESYTFWRACRDFVGDCKRADRFLYKEVFAPPKPCV